jgi:hypothetical protein
MHAVGGRRLADVNFWPDACAGGCCLFADSLSSPADESCTIAIVIRICAPAAFAGPMHTPLESRDTSRMSSLVQPASPVSL